MEMCFKHRAVLRRYRRSEVLGGVFHEKTEPKFNREQPYFIQNL